MYDWMPTAFVQSREEESDQSLATPLKVKLSHREQDWQWLVKSWRKAILFLTSRFLSQRSMEAEAILLSFSFLGRRGKIRHFAALIHSGSYYASRLPLISLLCSLCQRFLLCSSKESREILFPDLSLAFLLYPDTVQDRSYNKLSLTVLRAGLLCFMSPRSRSSFEKTMFAAPPS